MSESRALILVFTVFSLLVAATYIALTVGHATMAALTATLVVIACIGAYILSRVVMHYEPPEQRRKR